MRGRIRAMLTDALGLAAIFAAFLAVLYAPQWGRILRDMIGL